MRQTLGIRAAVGVLICGIFAFGCSRSPTAPSQSATAASPTSSGADSQPATQQANLTIEDLESRAGTVGRHRSRPLGRRAAVRTSSIRCCSPGRRRRQTGPPQSRYSCLITVYLLVRVVLIRSDLYSGQPCASTNGPLHVHRSDWLLRVPASVAGELTCDCATAARQWHHCRAPRRVEAVRRGNSLRARVPLSLAISMMRTANEKGRRAGEGMRVVRAGVLFTRVGGWSGGHMPRRRAAARPGWSWRRSR